MNRDDMDKVASDVRAALDEFGEAFKESMSFDYEPNTEEAARRDARMKSAIKVLSPNQMQKWLTALLTERDELIAELNNACYWQSLAERAIDLLGTTGADDYERVMKLEKQRDQLKDADS